VTTALEAMTAGADNDDPAATIDAHMGFHRAFYELSGHKLMLDLWRSWETQLQLFFSADHQSFADLHDVVAEHYRLLDFIDTGDMAAITAEIDRHVHGGIPAAEAAVAKDA
jgi:DNA-binding GntR family transcriptional regulator